MSTQDVVLFGTESLSDLAWYCLTHDSAYKPIGFTVDSAYMRAPAHQGLPVVPFERLTEHFPPATTRLMIPLGFHAINGLRRARYEQAKEYGYSFAKYVSSRASTWPDTPIGDNSLIYEHAIVQPFARIGNNVIVRSGGHISHHCTVADHAFIAAEVTLGGNVTVGEQSFVGLGAVIRDGITLAPRSMIGAGAVVLKDTEPDGVYVGNPARRIEKSAMDVTTGGHGTAKFTMAAVSPSEIVGAPG